MNLRKSLVGCGLILCLIAPTIAQRVRPKRPALRPLTPNEIARKTLTALVSITTYLPDHKTPLGYGSGFCIGRDPLVRNNVLIVTNYHVLKGGKFLDIEPVPSRGSDDEMAEDIYARYIDKYHDIAVLSAKISRAPLSLAPALPSAGDTIYVMGNPEGLEGSFSAGLVSATRSTPSPWIQITVAISHGSSGGPVLNTLGQVVGIATSAFRNGQNLNFAVPSTLINAGLAMARADPNVTWQKATDTLSEDQAADWQLVDQFTGMTTYYDADSIKDVGQGQRTMWVLAKITEPGHEDTYMNLMIFDCVNKQFKSLTFYRPGGQAQPISDEWSQSDDRALLNIACK